MVEIRDPQSEIFRALADPTRRAMIERLSRSDRTVGELAEPLEMSLAAASKHIRVLEQAGMVARRKAGRTHVMSLAPNGMLEARRWVERYAAFWDERLDALDEALRRSDDG